MRSWILLVSMLYATAFAGCRTEPLSAPQTAETESGPPSAPTSSTIKILNPGKEPHRELGSRITPGIQQKLKIAVENEVDGHVAILSLRQPQRSVTLELAVRTKKAEPGETDIFVLAIEKIDVDHSADVSRKTRKSWDSAASRLREMEGSYRVDSLGAVREVAMNVPSDASPEVWTIMADLEWALQQLGVPFPKEPVGVGAEWTVDRGIEQDGVNASELSTIKTTTLQEQLATMKKDVQQSAAPQTFRNPGSTVDVELVELVGKGTGEIRWDRRQPLPHAAEMSSTVTKRIVYLVEGKPLEATIVTRRTLSIAGTRNTPH